MHEYKNISMMILLYEAWSWTKITEQIKEHNILKFWK